MDGRERNRERVSFRPQEEEEEEEEEEEGGGSPPCGAIGQLHLMAGGYPAEGRGGGGGRDRPELEPAPALALGLASEGSGGSSAASPRSPSPPPPPPPPHEGNRKRAPRPALHEDVEMGCSGSSGSGTESHGNESHRGNDSRGNGSVGGSSGNGKDSALTESSESNKSSNSHSPSPPSSSTAFSLLSSEQDNPSTSGCSSEQSAKAKTQKELLKTLKDLKMHLPSEKRSKGKSSTLNTLKHALRCIKQVKANEEYYQMLMVSDSQPPGPDVSSYTIEEINSITSEYTLKNTDIFAVAVSLVTGRVVYISEQAASVLHCRREAFHDAKFVEFLTPQDVGVFYSFTTPYRLPSWSMGTGAESSPTECMQEKSFFCRISGGREREGVLRYEPFRMTPYLMRVQDAQRAEDRLCCLLLAQRLHSGYEAPRIPADKRIFTTTHTPNCVFQDVDERAIPLLGYLPQDLIGTPVLLKLHPSDRPLMLAVHRKILQFAGQPFDHSSTRFCAKNGEYVTLDTSWSSFVNPWSRKVSFVIGRHKVRMGPVNEDVFATPAFHGGKMMDSDIQEISEQVHRLLLQPVHHMGSSGYGSHGSNDGVGALAGGPSAATPTATEEETGRAKPRTFQEICKGVTMLKNQDPPLYPPWAPRPEQRLKASEASSPAALRSPLVRLKDLAPSLVAKDGTAAGMEDLPWKDQSVYSYQQISCLDSVIRYLENCNIPGTAKRKYQFSSHTPSSSDEDKKGSENGSQGPHEAHPGPMMLGARGPGGPPGMKGPKKTLAALPLPRKAESVVSLTSQCSYSSTIVHVGDKKLQPESELIEDVVESPPAAPPPPPPPSQEKEAYRRLGLTRQVLAAHTQKEEQAFLTRCRELRDASTFQKDCSTYLHRHRHLHRRRSTNAEGSSGARGAPHKPGAGRPEPAARKGSGRNRKSKKPRMRRPESSDSAASDRKPRPPPPPPPLQGLNQTSWSPSESASQSAFSAPYPGALVPGYPLSVYPAAAAAAAAAATARSAGPPDAPLSGGFAELQSSHQAPPPNAAAAAAAAPFAAPIVAPVVTLVLPNFLFPPLGPMGPMAAALSPAFFPEQTQQPLPAFAAAAAAAAYQPAYPLQPAAPYAALAPPPFVPQRPAAFLPLPQPAFQAPPAAYAPAPPPPPPPFQSQPAYSPQQHFSLGPPPASFGVPAQFVTQGPYPAPPFAYAMPPAETRTKEPHLRDDDPRGGEDGGGAASRSSTPASSHAVAAAAASPPLFESRCSSPLQLNLLSMEETLRSAAAAAAVPAGGETGVAAAAEDLRQEEEESPEDGAQSDGNLTSSDLLDILLLEDSRSATGSASSGSTGSRSRGSRSGLGSGSGSRGSGSRGSGSRGSRSGLGSGSGSGSNDCRTSASGASGSRTGSRNTSKYFGSVDSLGPDPRARVRVGANGGLEAPGRAPAPPPGDREGLARYRLQEPLWLLRANADARVMMTYQMPSRDIQKVLREDKQRLRLMQKAQPCFSSEQRRELVEDHPWMRRGGLPSTINVKECVYCEDAAAHLSAEEDHPGMDLGERGQEGTGRHDQIQQIPHGAGPQPD